MPRQHPGLALHRPGRLEPRAGDRGGQSPSGLVLVNVAGLHLDQVDLAGRPHPVQMLRTEDRSFPEVGSEVMDEYASFNVAGRRRLAVQANGSHQLQR